MAPYESTLGEESDGFTPARVKSIVGECLQPNQHDLCRRFLDQPYCWDTDSLQFVSCDTQAELSTAQDTLRAMVVLLSEMQASERTWIVRLHTSLRRVRAMRKKKWCMQALEDALHRLLLAHRQFHRWITAEVTQLQGWNMPAGFRECARMRVGTLTLEMIRQAAQDPDRKWGFIRRSLEAQLQRKLTSEETEVRRNYYNPDSNNNTSSEPLMFPEPTYNYVQSEYPLKRLPAS